MANTLKIKRGTAATIPQGQLAEPLFTTDTYDLYIGKGSGGNQRIQNYIASGTSSQFLKGDGSLDSTTYQATSEKGQNNGYASLDSGGKVPAAQLPNSIMDYKGTWDASTNTPTLADGTGNAGDVYICSVGGTQNLGSGSITFAAGDWVVYSGSVWQKSINSNAVASVNGQTGAVVLYTDDISEDGSPTNLWFTNARARAALSATSPVQYDNSTGVISILDASASQSGVVTTGTQTFAGAKTFSSNVTGLAFLTSANSYFQLGYGSDSASRSWQIKNDELDPGDLNIMQSTTRTGSTYSTKFRIKPDGILVFGNGTNSFEASGYGYVDGIFEATTIKKTAGTSSQFLKADGSVDSNTYLTTSSASSSYVPYTGATTNVNIGTNSMTAFNFYASSTYYIDSYNYFMKSILELRDNATSTKRLYITADTSESLISTVNTVPLKLRATSGVTEQVVLNTNGTINFTGAATFSSSVTATAFIPTGATIPTVGMYSSASNVLDFSAGTTNLLSLNYNTGLSTFNTGVRGYYFRIVNVSTAEFGINTENNQGYIGTTTSHGFNIMTNNTPRLEFHATTGAATFSSSVTAGGDFINGTIADNGTGRFRGSFTSVNTASSLAKVQFGGGEGSQFRAFMEVRQLWNGTNTDQAIGFTTFKGGVGSAEVLTLSPTGAATFSSSVTVNSNLILTATQIEQNDSNGLQINSSNGSGSIKFRVAGDQRAVITSGGNVGIGTTSFPASTYKLVVRQGTDRNFAIAEQSSELSLEAFNDLANSSVPLRFYSSKFSFLNGNVGIGTTSPVTRTNGTSVTIDNTVASFDLRSGGVHQAQYLVTSTELQIGSLSNIPYTFYTNSSERMRITSGGDVLIGRTSGGLNNTDGVTISDGAVQVEGNSYVFYGNRTASNGLFMGIRRNNVDVGDISVTTTSTSFNTSSDYRLKEDLKDFNALSIINMIKAYDFKWKLDNTRMYGVLAHELQSILPYSVTGIKDGERMQSADYSKLTPILVKAIQEQQAQIEELKSKLN